MQEKTKELGAFWCKTSSKGMNFMSGTFEIDGKKIEVVAFTNNAKKNPKEPDWRIYESRPREEKQEMNALPTKEDDNALIPENIPF